jgi:tetratricopeptide (TPR) repeat protein
MKLKLIISFIIITFVLSCSSKSNNPEFIKKTTGRYLFNSDELIEVYFKETDLYLKWRGATEIKPLKVDNNTFFVKEMNEKIQFLTNPKNQLYYMCLIPKEKDIDLIYNFKKLEENEKIPSEYLKEKQYNKALQAYLAIQQKDSLNNAINERNLNSLGYKNLRNKNIETAINIFKINCKLYPESSNVYDSLGEAYLKNGDTIKAIENYKKSLTLDSGNKRAKRQIENLKKVTANE